MNPTQQQVNVLDVRVRRTRRQLIAALFVLMKNAPFDTISVSEICSQANVHRTTFYSHFEDKTALLQYAMVEKQQDFLQRVLAIDQKSADAFYTSIFKQLLVYLKDNWPTLHKNAPQGNSTVAQVFHDVLFDSIQQIILLKRPQTLQTRDVPIDIIAQCISGALLSVATWWAEGNSSYAEDELCQYVVSLFSFKYHTLSHPSVIKQSPTKK